MKFRENNCRSQIKFGNEGGLTGGGCLEELPVAFGDPDNEVVRATLQMTDRLRLGAGEALLSLCPL